MESTLADTYRDVIGSVGFEAGWGRGPDNGDEEWDDTKLATLKHVVKSGLRQFYKPPVDQGGVSHVWSFMKPFIRMTLPSGQRELRMPFDFGGVEGSVYLTSSNVAGSGCCEVTGGVRARAALYPNQTGRPRFAEIEPERHTDTTRGQRDQMVFFPLPNGDYTLEMHYKISGQMISGDLPYAYGGPDHSETILASCLSIWEQRIDDIANGPRYQFWRECLAASISTDRTKRPQNGGYNADRSDDKYERRRGRYPQGYSYPPLRLNGVLYD